ncbi:MAG: Ig-like domain-containing protein [Propionibacteriales bacterium]|nr:Ig-like domain-containing protein [Propionibacteriales bacterium]
MAAGLSLVAVGAAEATLTAPAANGTVIAGNYTITDSGATNNTLVAGIPGTGCGSGNALVRIELANAANTAVLSTLLNVTGGSAVAAQAVTLTTRNFANGNYTIRSTVTNVVRGGLFGAQCVTASANSTRTVTITNTTAINYSGATTAPQNTSIPVSATVTDANISGLPVSGVTVNFTLAGGGSASAPTNAAGVATANLPVAGPFRTTTLSVSTPGNSSYVGSSTNLQFEVTKNASSTTLAQPAPVVHGQATSFTATVASVNGLPNAPTGTVQFTVDGGNFGAPVALVNGVATSIPTSSLSTTDHTIGAVYGGSSDHLGSSAATKTQVVNKAETTTQLTAAPSPTVSGQAVTFTAHVDILSPGVGDVIGGVQFNVDGAPFGTAVPLNGSDNATLTVSNLSTGNHDVEAVYNGNADFASSTSATVSHGVNRADTTVDLSSSANPAFSGAPITYTAVVAPVAPGAGTVGGTVQFAIDGDPLGGPVPVVGGQAVSPVANLQVGSKNVTANYSGDVNFAGQSDSLTQIVVAAQTTTTLTTNPNPSVFGQPVTLRAEVVPIAPATGNPTGFVRFIVDGASYDFVELSGQVAETTLTGIAVGPHTVKAVYLSDDLNFFTSTSQTLTQTVNKASTTTSLSTSVTPSVFGQPVTFTAAVSVNAPGAGAPTGSIVFKDGATVIGTEPVGPGTGEQASITVSSLSVGQHAISAAYSGDGSFNPSTGNVAQQVIRAQTTVTIASSANPAANGEGIQYTATVAPVAPGAGVPTGKVTFYVNGANLGSSRTLTDGVATSSNFASLTPGTYKITATYNGDGNFVGSTGYLDQGTGQVVTKGNTTMVLSSGPSPSVYGDAVTVSTTVSAVAPATRRPTGVVQIWEGGELLGATSLTPASASSTSESVFVTTGLSAGTHSLTAVYVGNFNFNGISKTTSQVVGQVPTVVGVESGSNPAVYGDTVTFTATVNASTGTPTGSVTFKEGSAVLGTAPVGAGGQATLAVPDLHAGTHTVKATYSGDVSFGASTSTGYDQVITKAPTTLVAADVNNPGPLAPRANYIRAKLTDRYGNPMAGRTISFTAPPGAARPMRNLCTAVTNDQGIAECNDQVISIDLNLNPGEVLLDIHGTYDATYVGDADTIGSTARGHEY